MRFSVIIPLYNKAPYIRRALESVVHQTYEDFELIVVDDGSTDNSYLAAKDALEGITLEHKIIRQANAGASTARNNGASVSRGDFLCFLDADDWWEPTFLERMCLLIQNFPDAGIYGTNYFYVKDGRKRICVTGAETGYIDYCKLYARNLAMPLTSISVALKRGIFQELKGFKPYLKLGEDFDLWIRIALEYKVAFLNEPLAYYFQDSAPEWRGTGKLQEPKYHFLWNLGYLEKEEGTNPDYKKLVDRMRTYSLLPYYLSRQYRNEAKQELAKVDWGSQPVSIRRQYSMPIPVLRFRRGLRKIGSNIKRWIIRNT